MFAVSRLQPVNAPNQLLTEVNCAVLVQKSQIQIFTVVAQIKGYEKEFECERQYR